MRELELKAVVPDLDACRERVLREGAVAREHGVLRDRRFDTPDRALRARDVVVRVREFTGSPQSCATLDWKSSASYDSGYKEREEISLGIDEAAKAVRILEELGLIVSFEIERDVEIYELHGATIRFERYARMDTLVEVEGAPDTIEQAIEALGIPRYAFTTAQLTDFARNFERRTGTRAAMSAADLTSASPYARDDA